jgi:hypothetical protein
MTYAAGFMQYEAHFGEGVTFYTIFGDVFAYLCGICLFQFGQKKDLKSE